VTPIVKNNRNLSTLHDQEIQKIKDEITERKKKELRDRMSKKFSIKYFNNYRRESRK